MKLTFTIAINDGTRTRGDVLELEDLGGASLALVDDLMHEMRDHLERLARIHAARVAKDGAA